MNYESWAPMIHTGFVTRPRTSTHREIFGILGHLPNAENVLAAWNRRFREEGRDADMVRYPTTVETLPERLSEMFHFDRRGYILAPALRVAIAPLLDIVDGQATVDTVWNDHGILRGFRFELRGALTEDLLERRWQLWFGGHAESSVQSPRGVLHSHGG